MKLRVLKISFFPLKCFKMGVFSRKLSILDEKFSGKKKIFRRFSNNPKFKGGAIIPLHPMTPLTIV